MAQRWFLCDLEQGELAELDNRRAGAKVDIVRRAARQAECPISRGDPAAGLATSSNTILKVIDEDWPEPVFCGRVQIPETKRSADSEGLLIKAADPFALLARRHWRTQITDSSAPVFGEMGFFVASDDTVDGTQLYSNVNPSTLQYGPTWANGTDESTILWELIDATDGHGIIQGTLADAWNRDGVTYPPGKQIAEAITEIGELENSADWELSPVEGTDGRLAAFSTFYPQQGSDLSATVAFEHGGEDQTATAFEHSEEPPTNEALVVGGIVGYWAQYIADLGAPPIGAGETDRKMIGAPITPVYLGVRAYHQNSIDEYGVHAADPEVLSEILSGTYLTNKAVGKVAASALPVPFFKVTPSRSSQDEGSGVRFAPDGDFYMGDIITADDLLDGITVEGRVNQATLTEQENGDVQLELECAPEVGSADVDTETLYLVGVGAA